MHMHMQANRSNRKKEKGKMTQRVAISGPAPRGHSRLMLVTLRPPSPARTPGGLLLLIFDLDFLLGRLFSSRRLFFLAVECLCFRWRGVDDVVANAENV